MWILLEEQKLLLSVAYVLVLGCGGENRSHNMAAAAPEILFGTLSSFNPMKNRLFIGFAAGHDEIIAGMKCRGTVRLTARGGAPVGHHNPVKAPFSAQNVGA